MKGLSKIPVDIASRIRAEGIKLNLQADLALGVLGQIRKRNGKFFISIQSFDYFYRRRMTMAQLLGIYTLFKDKISDIPIRIFDK